jgi:TonB family protein
VWQHKDESNPFLFARKIYPSRNFRTKPGIETKGKRTMTDRQLLICLAASLSIHVTLIAATSHFFIRESRVLPLPIQRVELVQVEALDLSKPAPMEPPTKPKTQNITAPKLLSNPRILPKQGIPSMSNNEEQREQLKKSEGEKPPLPETSGSEPGQAAGGVALSTAGDTDAADGISIKGTSGGGASLGLGHGSKGDGTGGDYSSEKKSSTIARPLAGYQVKPRYPESARQARAQGTTVLKFRVLTTGKVADVHIEKSAGRRDLDEAAADAVKKWLFEPARMGTEPVVVWVTLPMEFKLY